MRRIFLSCIVLALVGCAAERTVLVNSQGDQLTCETSGAGFLGRCRFPISSKSVSLTLRSAATG